MKRNTKKDKIKWNDLALLGSALGNIIQVFDRASGQKDLNAVKQLLHKATIDKNFLLFRLREWQKAYSSLKDEALKLERKISELESDFSKQKDEIYMLQKEQLKKDDQIEKLEKENMELKKKLEKKNEK